MIVKQSNLQLASSHQHSSSQRTVVELERGPARAATPAARPTAEAAASAATDSLGSPSADPTAVSDGDSIPPQLRLMKDLVESLLGRMFELFDDASLDTTSEAAASAPDIERDSVTLRAVQEYREHELVTFAAQGVIQTCPRYIEIDMSVGWFGHSHSIFSCKHFNGYRTIKVNKNETKKTGKLV